MFGLKGRDTFNKPTSDIGMIVKKAKGWWIKLFPYMLLGIILYIIVIIGYTWYTYLEKKDVSEQEKKEYIGKKMKEITFKKEKFDILKDTVSKRQERFNEQKNKYGDIFYEPGGLQEESQEDIVETNE